MIGGSMKSEAVRLIAPAIFGRDIILPEPSEAVADGAARQAAWVLNVANGEDVDTLPTWKLAGQEVISADSTPEVKKQYDKVKNLPTAGEIE
jgi:xylulokinase